jgi:hypothetical protein
MRKLIVAGLLAGLLGACAPVPLKPGEKTQTPWQCADQVSRGGDCDKR